MRHEKGAGEPPVAGASEVPPATGAGGTDRAGGAGTRDIAAGGTAGGDIAGGGPAGAGDTAEAAGTAGTGGPAEAGGTARTGGGSAAGSGGVAAVDDGAAAGGTGGGGHGAADVAALTAGLVVFGAAVAAYALMVLGHPQDLWRMSDLEVYRWGGLLARHTHRLYEESTGGFGFTYPPMAGAIFAVLSVFSMRTLRWLSALSGLASLVLSVGIAWRMLDHRRVAVALGATFAVSGAALWTEPVQKTLWFGQVNLVLMLIVLADLAQRDGCRWKGAGVGLATGIKLTPAIFVVYLLVTRRFRAAAVACGTFVATVAVGFAALPHESRQYWLTGLFASPGRIGPIDWVGNQSLYGMLVRLLGTEHAARPYWLAATAATAALGLWLAARFSRRGDELPAVVTCAVTGLLVSPVSWSHHWVWIAPGLVLAADGATRAIRAAGGAPAASRVRPAWHALDGTRGRARPRPTAGHALPRPGTAPPPARISAPASAGNGAGTWNRRRAGTDVRRGAGAWSRAAVRVIAAPVPAVLFGAWIFKVHGLPALPEGLIRSVPFGSHREQHWHGTELLIGNLYVVVSLAGLLALAALLTRGKTARSCDAVAAMAPRSPE